MPAKKRRLSDAPEEKPVVVYSGPGLVLLNKQQVAMCTIALSVSHDFFGHGLATQLRDDVAGFLDPESHFTAHTWRNHTQVLELLGPAARELATRLYRECADCMLMEWTGPVAQKYVFHGTGVTKVIGFANSRTLQVRAAALGHAALMLHRVEQVGNSDQWQARGDHWPFFFENLEMVELQVGWVPPGSALAGRPWWGQDGDDWARSEKSWGHGDAWARSEKSWGHGGCVDPLFSQRLLAKHSSERRLYRPGDGRRFDVEVALAGRLPAPRPDLLVGLPRRRKRQAGASVTVELGADGKWEDVGAGDEDAAKRRQIVSSYILDAKNRVQLNGNSRQEREMRGAARAAPQRPSMRVV